MFIWHLNKNIYNQHMQFIFSVFYKHKICLSKNKVVNLSFQDPFFLFFSRPCTNNKTIFFSTNDGNVYLTQYIFLSIIHYSNFFLHKNGAFLLQPLNSDQCTGIYCLLNDVDHRKRDL